MRLLVLAAARLAALKHERERLGADVRAVAVEVDPEALRSSLERRLGQPGETLRSNPESARRALAELLRGERLRVGPDPERGFRVERTGWLSVALEERSARNPQESERLTRQVAGERYVAEGTERDYVLVLAA